jgi:uncharacterized delta-60 repeat protein
MAFPLYRGPALEGDLPMWFFPLRKTHRTAAARSARNTFRPRLDALEDRCLLSAGALDPTFGTAGMVNTGGSGGYPAPLVVQPDGKIVVVAPGATSSFLERFNAADGSIDTTFGTSGKVSVSNSVYGLAIDANNKIVAVGRNTIRSGNTVTDYVTTVARYNTNGSLDSTFGNGGIVQTNVNPSSYNHKTKTSDDGSEAADAVAIQADGKIDVGGLIAPSAPFRPGEQFMLLRYNSNGTLDTSFGNQSPKNGINITPPFGGGNDIAEALTIQSDGNIVLAGVAAFTNVYPSFTGTMAVARYVGSGAAAGQLDSTFGTGGTVTLVPAGAQQAGALGALVQSNGTIVLGGTAVVGSALNGTLVRLKSNGQLDTTFANAGSAICSINSADLYGALGGQDLAQGANGDLMLVGSAVAAYLPGGAVDAAFGSNSISTAAGGSQIGVQRDGKIVLLGGSTLARLVPSNTQVGWPTASPNPVSAGASVTLTASTIYDNAYPSATITQVSFYQDTNGNGTLDGMDLFLGTGTLNSTTGVWSITVSTTGWAKGTYTILAQAWDGSIYYDPVSIQVTVV